MVVKELTEEEKVKKRNREKFFNNIRKSERYSVLAILTGKKKESIKVFFNRKKIDIFEDKNFLEYLKEHYISNR